MNPAECNAYFLTLAEGSVKQDSIDPNLVYDYFLNKYENDEQAASRLQVIGDSSFVNQFGIPVTPVILSRHWNPMEEMRCLKATNATFFESENPALGIASVAFQELLLNVQNAHEDPDADFFWRLLDRLRHERSIHNKLVINIFSMPGWSYGHANRIDTLYANRKILKRARFVTQARVPVWDTYRPGK